MNTIIKYFSIFPKLLSLLIELILHWKQDFYSFSEKGPATVELVTNSCVTVNFTIFGEPVGIRSGVMIQEVFLRALGPIFLQFPFNTVNFNGRTYGIASVGTSMMLLLRIFV